MFLDILQFTLQDIESGTSIRRMAATYCTEKQSKPAEWADFREPKNLNHYFNLKKLKSNMR